MESRETHQSVDKLTLVSQMLLKVFHPFKKVRE